MTGTDPSRDLEERLRSLGRASVPAEMRAMHLQRAAATASGRPRRRFGRLAVAAAALVGFAAGSTGLAFAGALPDPAQDVAHDVLGAVNIGVPEGKRGPCVSAAARTHKDDKVAKQAAKDACPKGKPDTGDDGPGNSDLDAKINDGDLCTGPPPWAGGNAMTKAEKDAFKEARRAACGEDDDADDIEDSDELEPSDTGGPGDAGDRSPGAKGNGPAPRPSPPSTPPSTPSTVETTTTTAATETSRPGPPSSLPPQSGRAGENGQGDDG